MNRATPPEYTLRRTAFGALELDLEGQVTVGVVAVRAFPIAAPDQAISLVGPEGNELLWIDRLEEQPEANRRLIEEALSSREFMPEIRRLIGVSSFATPCTWHVETDRGECDFILRGEEGIRRLPHGMLLITDSHGIAFLVRDPAALDRHSRRLLDRFL